MVVQRNGDWVKTASPEQIVTAQRAGELVTYLGGKTVEEQAHDAHVAGAPDRVQAAAYGLAVDQLRSNGARDSTWYEKKRRGMDAEQLEKLDWVESSTPADVFAAEQAGELDHLLGKDVSDEAARLGAVRAHVRTVMGG